MEYLVDVIMLVYNHEKFLAQAIDSIVSQKTNFNYRVLIGEDCSKDSSRTIVQKYAAMYPDKIVPLLYEKNMGATANLRHVMSVATSKYIAICEGDDYWTDDTKLQKQVDFMEPNPDFSICFTDVEIVDGNGTRKSDDLFFAYKEKDVYTIEDIIHSFVNIIPTPSLFFRNILPRPLPEFYEHIFSGDYCLHVMLADKGKAKRLPFVAAAYRDHTGGITKGDLFINKEYEIVFNLLEILNKYLDYKYDTLIRKRLFETSKTMLIFGSRNKNGMERLRHYLHVMPKYLKYGDKINMKEIAYYHAILFFPWMLKLKKS